MSTASCDTHHLVDAGMLAHAAAGASIMDWGLAHAGELPSALASAASAAAFDPGVLSALVASSGALGCDGDVGALSFLGADGHISVSGAAWLMHDV
jgi:hypothetical protein